MRKFLCFLIIFFALVGILFLLDHAKAKPPKIGGVVLSKEVDKMTVSSGETLNYIVTYKNTGDPVQNVIIQEPVPDGTSYIDNSAKLNGSPSGQFANNTINWGLGNLRRNQSGTVSFQVKIQ